MPDFEIEFSETHNTHRVMIKILLELRIKHIERGQDSFTLTYTDGSQLKVTDINEVSG